MSVPSISLLVLCIVAARTAVGEKVESCRQKCQVDCANMNPLTSFHTAAEVRLFFFWTHEDTRKCCDLLIARSLPLWNKGGFRKCFAGLPVEIKEGGFITPYTITVNTSNIKNFARKAKMSNKFAFINRKLNLNAQDCATVTSPDWQKTLGDLRTSYPVEINVYTTTADQADINCTAVIEIIRKASPFLIPIGCQQEVTPSEITQIYHHRFDVNMSMPDRNDRPVTEAVVQQLHWIQRIMKIERSSCLPISVPTYDSERKTWNFPTILNENRASTVNCSTIRDLTKCSPKSCKVQMIPGYMGPQILKVQFGASICGQLSGSADYRAVVFLINSILNGMKANCPIIRYAKTKDAFDKVPNEGYYYALVSAPTHVDVCQKAKKHIEYGAHVCEEIQNVSRTHAQNKQRTVRMRLVRPIYLADIPWYMNEHSKFVHYLNSRSAKCRFN